MARFWVQATAFSVMNRMYFGGGVLHHHVGYFVGVGDDMGLDAQAAVLFALRLYDLILSGIYYHWFFGSFPWVFLR